MRILMMTAIAALAIGTTAEARQTHPRHAGSGRHMSGGGSSGSKATAELNRKSLEQASAMGSRTAPMPQSGMAQPGMAQPDASQPGMAQSGTSQSAPMSSQGSMNSGTTSTMPLTPGGDATQAPATPPAGTTPQ